MGGGRMSSMCQLDKLHSLHWEYKVESRKIKCSILLLFTVPNCFKQMQAKPLFMFWIIWSFNDNFTIQEWKTCMGKIRRRARMLVRGYNYPLPEINHSESLSSIHSKLERLLHKLDSHLSVQDFNVVHKPIMNGEGKCP